MFTPFPELNALLRDLNETAREILQDTYVGGYLQGSFALGSGDAQSDADFIIVTTETPSGQIEADLRRLHAAIPTRPGFWSDNIEGSYADADSLRGVGGLGKEWLFVDRAHRDMTWDEHCNNLHTRWILRNHGIVLGGPPTRYLIDPISEKAMREAARQALPGMLEGIREWADMNHTWTQKYIVQTYSRVLYTMMTGKVASKAAAIQWARSVLDSVWLPLLTQVAEDRATPWKPVDPPLPGNMQRAYEYAAYVEKFAANQLQPRKDQD
ncbi:aminoglycoside adenylyltransferase domain-containing protein [Yaniella halotolerans]|uniref:aminoglycoside adenylyltransferase domain-containing protein n=1 Tax=Yaniella halotolerans TaxID=225453 RepID=UPI0003B793EF|nr:aminoglycoside adenylyltransferase domain-containing protein [Yaniella halotolerans]